MSCFQNTVEETTSWKIIKSLEENQKKIIYFCYDGNSNGLLYIKTF